MFQEQLIYTRSCLQSAEAELIDQTKKVAQLTEKLENERATSEAAALKLATLSSAVQNNTDILIKDKQSLTQQVRFNEFVEREYEILKLFDKDGLFILLSDICQHLSYIHKTNT